jgi:hypothetical protein
MSIGIDVDSIVTPRERRDFGPPSYQDYQYAELRALCGAFGWPEAPWQEPSRVRGETDTSCSSMRYYRLLGAARAHARGTPFHEYNEERPPALTADEARLFPHLLVRATWSNYYLPVEFDLPRLFEGYWGTASAGSAIHLRRELTQLDAALPALRARSQAAPDAQAVAVALRDAGDICALLLSAAEESVALKLPLLLRG